MDRAIGDVERLLLDSSTLIAFHSPDEVAYPIADHILGRIESATDRLRGYISTVGVVELLIRPIRTSQAHFTFMHEFLTSFPNLTVLPMDTIVAVQAATLRASMRLPLPDAVVIASNDARWQQRGKTLFPQFRWLYLGDYL